MILIHLLCIGVFVAIAQAQDCGRVIANGRELRSTPAVTGKLPKRGEVPWVAGIYRKNTSPYMHICGGSIVSNNVVLTAAHCFWSSIDKLLPAEQFAVAVGKIYRPWNSPTDVDAQKSDIKEIHLSPRYQGSATSYQDDIAAVIVSSPFEFTSSVQPICLNFDTSFDTMQLQPNNRGKVAGWGLGADGKVSPILRVLDISYIDVRTCLADSPTDFLEYITSDKICARSEPNSRSLCRGDGGNGLAFPALDKGSERFYLRGITSISPYQEECNTPLAAFTHIIKHEAFIMPFLTK